MSWTHRGILGCWVGKNWFWSHILPKTMYAELDWGSLVDREGHGFWMCQATPWWTCHRKNGRVPSDCPIWSIVHRPHARKLSSPADCGQIQVWNDGKIGSSRLKWVNDLNDWEKGVGVSHMFASMLLDCIDRQASFRRRSRKLGNCQSLIWVSCWYSLMYCGTGTDVGRLPIEILCKQGPSLLMCWWYTSSVFDSQSLYTREMESRATR